MARRRNRHCNKNIRAAISRRGEKTAIMKNISFSITTEQFKNRTKTVTRRLGWKTLKAGQHLMGCKKCMGLKPGEKIEKLGEIRIVRVWQEQVQDINEKPADRSA